MTKTFATDNKNDLTLNVSGFLSVASDRDAILSACESAAKAQLGEMMFSVDQGVPNFDTIWSSSRNVAQYEAFLRKVISGVDGVLRIESLEVSLANNVASYTATIATAFGTGVINA